MGVSHNQTRPITFSILTVVGSIGIILVVILDAWLWRIDFFAEGYPDFSSDYLVRSGLIFLSTAAIVWGLVGWSRPTFNFVVSEGLPIKIWSIRIVLLLSTMFLFLFIVSPSVFSALSRENSLIELSSALLLFGSSGLFMLTWWMARNNSKLNSWIVMSFIIMSGVFFVIAMEEVSWFQGLLNIETPDSFAGNVQHEMNLHNFATDYFENLYYFGSFVFLVVLPFTGLVFPKILDNNYLRIFIGRPYIAIIGTIACAYNFDMWNIVFIQISFFFSLMVLFSLAVLCRIKHELFVIIFAIVLLVTTQITFLSNGLNLVRIWEVTEYKEFFIPLAFFIYSIDVTLNIRQEFFIKSSESYVGH